MKQLRSLKAKNKRFFFSYETDPITNNLEPVEAVEAWFSISKQEYNPLRDRYEAFSTKYQLNIYYVY